MKSKTKGGDRATMTNSTVKINFRKEMMKHGKDSVNRCRNTLLQTT